MRHADVINFLFRIMPFITWKDMLLRTHIENCPVCLARLASREEVRRVLVREEDVVIRDRFWQEIEERIYGSADAIAPPAKTEPTSKLVWQPGRWAWRSATVVLGITLVAVLTIALVHFLGAPVPGSPGTTGATTDAESGPEQIQIHYVRIGSDPAQIFIFKPHDSDVVIVWAGKTH